MTGVLGAILAGGASSRFGSDKAMAEWRGKPLIEHVITRLRPQVSDLVVVGRDYPGEVSIPDRPAPGLGPLGGLCAALRHAAAGGYDAVLTSGCDLPELPLDLREALGEGPAFVLGQPLLALWPVGLAGVIDLHLAHSVDRSLRGWVALTGARGVDIGPIRNVNRPGDL
ncbi:molybdenum cofactor guanylyltransferase [Polymorphobacter sp. PAMC 29334]|uniref:molybdenum cofactor guanylyltransferase n=1 Tax=Polymorphobacter sp. PAMC 29334 TaxID=2862331 RepID=UPI001C663B2A|nr:molybdenum cofactor guanylyltransferase [Polymorphobacter sp. PAMC 29334]QYE34532.1 molybdenum cofactor guanylyltransferase [Polymorphobacter sp. PAMC 29334]